MNQSICFAALPHTIIDLELLYLDECASEIIPFNLNVKCVEFINFVSISSSVT